MSETKFKAGDEVAIVSGYGNKYRLTNIDRVTPSGRMFTKCDRVFNPDGWARGSSGYHRSRLEQVTPKIREIASRQRLLSKLYGIERKLASLPIEALELIAGIIEANPPKEAS